jgi:uncharacterized protein (DUF2141 family)
MNGCTYWSLIITTALFSVIFSCARQAAPTGGLKDITPPKITKSNPPISSLNFNGKKIIISFNEFIAIDKMTEKFMISPPLVKKPNIIVKGKTLEIEFFEKLKDSTTYTLYFQDAVRDLNEGNPILNFQFVFSTGNVLDSLSVTGNVYYASNLEVPENTLILMHTNMADSAPVRLLPDYISQVDSKGGFRINNIKSGHYRLFALQEKNNNKKFDFADENFAFLDNDIEINKEKNYLPEIVVKDTSKSKTAKKKAPVIPLIDGEFKLYMFTAPKKNHYLTSSVRKSANLLKYTLSLPPDTIKFNFHIPDAAEGSYFIEKNITNDTIDIWLTDSLLYSKHQINTLVGFPFTDSTGVTILKTDTIPMLFTPVRAPRSAKAKEAQLRYAFKTNIPGVGIAMGQPIIFMSETPFRSPDTTKIRLYKTEKTGKISVPYELAKDSSNSRRYILKAQFKEGAFYLLIADSASFRDIYNGVSDSTGIKFSVRTPDTYGKLTLNVSNVKGNIVIQLLDTKEKPVTEKEIKKDGKIIFSLIDVGKYRLRAINDLNGDGKWTTGDFKFKRQPEPVTYFPEEIVIKANWDSEETWSLEKWNQKDQKLREKKDQ